MELFQPKAVGNRLQPKDSDASAAERKADMDNKALVTGLYFFLGSMVFSSFVEYSAHRVLHQWRAVGKIHREHHARNEGQGVLWEYLDYVKPSMVLMIPPFFVSLPAGIGFFIGGNFFALLSAYSHQIAA